MPVEFTQLTIAAGLVTALAVFCAVARPLRPWAFTAWVLAAFLVPMAAPTYFIAWGEFELKQTIVPIVQLIMFGMGATLTLTDFARVAVRPKPILIGVALQFMLMPLTAWLIVNVLQFDPEVAAGMILLGACSGGMASNVIAYLARGDVALSVTMTCCSTLASPLLTPLAMKLLAGKLVPVPFLGMMASIVSLILVPVFAGLFAHYLRHGRSTWQRSPIMLVAISIGCAALAATLWSSAIEIQPLETLRPSVAFSAALIAVVAAGQWIALTVGGPDNWLERMLPAVSMTAICLSIALITALSHDTLKQIGLLLVAASALHNGIGYVAGYWAAWACGLSQRERRTVSIEVGLQNGGMATGLAIDVLQSSKAALAPAIFGAWQNVSGSLLAMYWKRGTAECITEQPHEEISTASVDGTAAPMTRSKELR